MSYVRALQPAPGAALITKAPSEMGYRRGIALDSSGCFRNNGCSMRCSTISFCRNNFSVPTLICLALLGGSPRSSLAADTPPAIPAIDLCRGQFKAGQYEQCIESAQKAIEERAFSAEWRALLIESRMALGRYAEAAEDANSIIEYYSLSFRLLKLGYEVYTCNGQAEKASETLARIYQTGTRQHIDFLDSEDLVILGETLLLLGGEPRLVLEQFFNRAIRNDPN